MLVKEAIEQFKAQLRSESKKGTRVSYNHILKNFEILFAEREIETIKPDEIYQFLEIITEGLVKSTRRLRYSQMKAFFNSAIEKFSLDIKNP
jgi:hypothetical protein